MVSRLWGPLRTYSHLFWKFHVVPWGRELAAAVRRNPWIFVATSAIVAILVLRPGARGPALPLSEPALGALLAGIPLLGVLVGFPVLRRTVAERRFFYVRPGGPRALVWYGFFWLLIVWALGSAVGWWVVGPGGWVGVPGWIALGPLVCWLLARIPAKSTSSQGVSFGSNLGARLPGVPAFVLSHPVYFFGPFVLCLGILIWALGGGAGFVWADHPPISGLLADFLWPTLFGLVWADVARIVPNRYFRMAHAPASRLLLVLGTPALVETLVILIFLSFQTASPSDLVRLWALNGVGMVFWFFFGLRWGPASLFSMAVSWAIVVLGLGLHQDWWWAWALVLVIVAVVAAAGWWSMVRENPGEEGLDG